MKWMCRKKNNYDHRDSACVVNKGPQGKQRQEEEEEIKNENSFKPRSISTQVIGSIRVQMSRMEFVENPIPKSVSPSLGEPL